VTTFSNRIHVEIKSLYPSLAEHSSASVAAVVATLRHFGWAEDVVLTQRNAANAKGTEVNLSVWVNTNLKQCVHLGRIPLGPPAALARLRPNAALASDAENSRVTLAVASSSHVGVLNAAAPLTGKRRDPESGSESSGLVEAPSADALAMVPLTPGDGQAQGLRRSLREHKKPRPYYAGAEPQPPDKRPAGKGLQRGFFN